nr:hypothetical protein [Tanacetum cinerariifolium]
MVRPSQWDKGYVRPAWTRGPERARNIGGPREAQSNIEVYTPYPRKDTFTPLTKTPKEILAMESRSSIRMKTPRKGTRIIKGGPTSDLRSLEKIWGRENAKEAFNISHEHPDQYVTMGTILTSNYKQLLADVFWENREVSFSFPFTFSIMAKKDMDLQHSRLTPDDLYDLIIKYKIPCDLYTWLSSEEFVMSELSNDASGIYHQGHLGLNKVITFEVLCRSLQIEPTVTLFRVFQTLCKQGDWFSFAKHHASSLVCIDDNRSCMKHWKSGFFLIDRRAIMDAMVWIHPDVAIDDPRPTASSFNMADVRRLSAYVIKLRDMLEVVLVFSRLVLRSRRSLIYMLGQRVKRLPFYCTPPVAINAVIPNPKLEDLAAGTPTDDDESYDDAYMEIPLVTPLHSAAVIPSSGNQGGSSVAPTARGSNTRDSRGKGIMVDDVVAPSGGVSRQRPVLTKEVFKNPVACKTIVDQFPTPGEMVRVEDSRLKGYKEKVAGLIGLELEVSTLKKQVYGLNDKLSTFDASFSKPKAKGKERKKKIKFLSKSLDNLHSKGFVWKFLASDEFRRVHGELLYLAANAGFERGLIIPQLEPEKLVLPTNVPILGDTRVSPPIAKESIVTLVFKSLELSANVVPASFVVTLEQNEEQGTYHVLDDVAEVTMVGSESVSYGFTDVVMALSAGEKGDGSAPSSTVKEVVVPLLEV